MKRRVLLLVVACAVVGLGASCIGQWKPDAWDRLPLECKTQIITRDYSGDQELSIMVFPHSEEAWKSFLGDLWSEREASVRQLISQAAITFSGGASLVVGVAPYGNQYWWPWDLVITQAPSQYSIDYDDIVKMDDPFDGGQIKAGMSTWGLVRIPSGVDLTQPFQVWYGDYHGEIKSFLPVLQADSVTP